MGTITENIIDADSQSTSIEVQDSVQSVGLTEVIDALELNLVKNSTLSYEIVDDVKTENRTVNITPKLAEFLLTKNQSNRPLNLPNVVKMVKDMIAGDWNYDGTPIVFDKYGNLLNGQHRLTAVVTSKKTLPFKVSTGYKTNIFATIDIGKTRTGGDVLAIAGYENYTMFAQTANFMFKFMRGSITQNASKPSRQTSSPNTGLSHKELLKFVELKPFIKNAILFALKTKKKQPTSLMPNYMVSGLYFLFSEKDQNKADSFLTKLLVGEGLESDSSIFHLRNRLLNSKFDKTKRLQHNEVVKLTILAWNYYRIGKKVKMLKTPDSLPVIS